MTRRDGAGRFVGPSPVPGLGDVLWAVLCGLLSALVAVALVWAVVATSVEGTGQPEPRTVVLQSAPLAP